MAAAVARVLGAIEAPGRSAVEVLVEAVGERRILFVLDNFEQVIEAAPVVAELLQRCPNATVVATSRAALRVSGEREFPVPGLPTPPDTSRLSMVERENLPPALAHPDPGSLSQYEAVRLFIARAVAARPDFAVTNENAPAVAQICARLQGMPLAIELAAARVRLLSPDEILRRLERQLGLLTSGARDLPPRQQTLRGAIAWSYDLVAPGCRRLLDRLSVFRAGTDLEAAEAVCGPAEELGIDVFDGLASLVEQSLVRSEERGGMTRFVLLEAIREYAAEMLTASGEADAIRRRHVRWFRDLAEAAAPHLAGADQRRWLDRLEVEHDNLRAAIDAALEDGDGESAARLGFGLWRFWQQRGYLNEARMRLEAMAGLLAGVPAPILGRYYEATGGIAYWQADAEAAAAAYDRALAIWRDLGDQREIANALYNRGYVDIVQALDEFARGVAPEEVERGRSRLEEALGIYRELGDTTGEANLLWALGGLAYFRNELPRSHHRLPIGPRPLPPGRPADHGGLVPPHARECPPEVGQRRRGANNPPARPPPLPRGRRPLGGRPLPRRPVGPGRRRRRLAAGGSASGWGSEARADGRRPARRLGRGELRSGEPADGPPRPRSGSARAVRRRRRRDAPRRPRRLRPRRGWARRSGARRGGIGRQLGGSRSREPGGSRRRQVAWQACTACAMRAGAPPSGPLGRPSRSGSTGAMATARPIPGRSS
ncbi:MAG: hypothetical protein KatS3mg065_0304 [Chloroflexota bacterium]|nr:MAG: hypothetical protein KatS3mg065_0304 [Chloroflexota bacterium]